VNGGEKSILINVHSVVSRIMIQRTQITAARYLNPLICTGKENMTNMTFVLSLVLPFVAFMAALGLPIIFQHMKSYMYGKHLHIQVSKNDLTIF
jgi:hypothetical protein